MQWTKWCTSTRYACLIFSSPSKKREAKSKLNIITLLDNYPNFYFTVFMLFFCFSGVLQHRWAPAGKKGSTTVHPCCWPNPEPDRHLLHCDRQTAHPMPSHQLIGFFWRTVQISLCVQPVLRGVVGPAIHICPDNSIQHRHQHNRWVSQNPWVAGKTLELGSKHGQVFHMSSCTQDLPVLGKPFKNGSQFLS